MAIGRLSVKVGKAGKASPHAVYIARLGQYGKRLEQGEKLEAFEFGNMPKWAASNPLTFGTPPTPTSARTEPPTASLKLRCPVR